MDLRTPGKLILRALSGERTLRPPIWLMRQAGRYLPEYHAVRAKAGGMLALCNTPELAVEVTLQPLRRFRVDAVILFADLPQIANALGQGLKYEEGEGPVLSPPIRSATDLGQLDPEVIHERLAPVYETVRRLALALPADVALIGFAGAPWTVATYMVEGRSGTASGFAHVKRWAFADPDGFQRLIDLLTDAVGQYLEQQIRAGAEAVQLFDSWASVLPEPYFHRWCIQPVRVIVDRLRQWHPTVPIIGFPRGAGLLYEGYAASTGVNAVGLDETIPVAWAARHIQQARMQCVQGNLDPQFLVVGGSHLAVEATRIMSALGTGPFVFNLGHGVAIQTPPEHVTALVNQVRHWQIE
jgi:uroporphyrinogen decarboxylase